MAEKIDLIKVQFDYIEKIRELNMQEIIFRIPKILIIRNIMIYLTDHEIIDLGQTCKEFRTLIYSPFTFRLLFNARAKYHTASNNIYQKPNTIVDNAKKNAINNEINKKNSNEEDLRAQVNTLENVQDFLYNKIKDFEDELKMNQKEISNLKNERANWCVMNKKNVKKILVLENIIKAYELAKELHNEEIRNLNIEYQKSIIEKDGDIKLIKKENNKIQEEIDALILQIKPLQEENQKFEALNNECMTILNNMRTIFMKRDFFNKVQKLNEKKNIIQSSCDIVEKSEQQIIKICINQKEIKRVELIYKERDLSIKFKVFRSKAIQDQPYFFSQ